MTNKVARESPLQLGRRAAFVAAIEALNADELSMKYAVLFPGDSAVPRETDKAVRGRLDNSIAFYIGRNCVKSLEDVRQLKYVMDPLKGSLAYAYTALYAPVRCARLSIEGLLGLKAPHLGRVSEYLLKEVVRRRTPRELRIMRNALLKVACVVERHDPSLYQPPSPLAVERPRDLSPLAEMPDSDAKAILLALVGANTRPRAALRALRMLMAMQATPTREESLVHVLTELVHQPEVVARARGSLVGAVKSLQSADSRATLLVELVEVYGTARSSLLEFREVWEVLALMGVLTGLAGASLLLTNIVAGPTIKDIRITSGQVSFARLSLSMAVVMVLPWCVVSVIQRIIGIVGRKSLRAAALDEIRNYALLKTDDARRLLLQFAVTQRGGRQRAFNALRFLPPKEKAKAAGFAFAENDRYYQLLVDSARMQLLSAHDEEPGVRLSALAREELSVRI